RASEERFAYVSAGGHQVHPLMVERPMRKLAGRRVRSLAPIFCSTLLMISLCHAQAGEEQGYSIGKVSIQGNLIVLELNDGALGRSNLFDLNGRTLFFSPGRSGYRIE